MNKYQSGNSGPAQHESDRKNTRQVMLYAALASMKW